MRFLHSCLPQHYTMGSLSHYPPKRRRIERTVPKVKRMIATSDLSDFNLVALHGGFGLAARASGRPKATLSRHVRALEDRLGLRLIERDGTAFRLTDEGRSLFARTEGPLAELTEAVAALTHLSGPPRGKLRVSCPLMFGHLYMGRIAASFVQRYPEVQLEVSVEDRQVDLIEEGFDVALRINPKPDSQLVGRPLFRDELLIVAPAGLARPDDPMMPVPAVTGLTAPALQSRMVVEGNDDRQITLKSILRLPTPLMVRDAVLAGAGVGILPRRLVAGSLARGRMQDWGRLPDGRVEFWALHASRRLTSRKVAAFIEHLTDEVRDRVVPE
ncbi:MAG: LysR family transcriptional regulator [Paracoccaceae bacterium]